MYCPNCASQIHGNIKFCKSCGTNLDAISNLLNGRIIEPPKSVEILALLEKCHNGYLSTLIGLSLVIASLLIIIAATMLGALPAALVTLVLVSWAITAIAQGVGRWQTAKREMISVLSGSSGVPDAKQLETRLPSEAGRAGSPGFGGSVTERTTASLDQRA
ncbi:MAG TPA: zinc ribbon domain-containing protein [Blastocatellia bacterium]|nr:zinc ribbon domain-containing protein [Blastocatellia bacterium]